MVVVIVGCVSLIVSWALPASEISPPIYLKHSVDELNSAGFLLWEREIYMPNGGVNSPHRQFVAAEKMLFVIGSMEEGGWELLAFDSDTGNLVWSQAIRGTKFLVDTNRNLIFVDDDLFLVAFNVLTGEEIWRIDLPWSHTVSDIFMENEQLYVRARKGNRSAQEIFYQIDNLNAPTISQIGYHEIQVSTEHYETGQAMDDLVVAQSGFRLRIYDKPLLASSDHLWQVEDPVISNVVLSNSAVFYLTNDGTLHIVDPWTGDEISWIKFVPEIPIYEIHDSQNRVYLIAFDEKASRLFVILGSGNQMFAIQLNP